MISDAAGFRWQFLALVMATATVLTPIGPVAGDPLPVPGLTLSAPASGKAGLPIGFTVVLTDQTGVPLTDARIAMQRRDATWTTAASGISDGAGRVVANATLPAGTTRWRASYGGDQTHAPTLSAEVAVTGLRYASALVLSGPGRIVDETAGSLNLLWTAMDGSPVGGQVTVYRRFGTAVWAPYTRVRTTTGGRATVTVAPRADSTWRAIGAPGPWWLPATSGGVSIDNVAPTAPADLPKSAPQPVPTPVQARASGAGAHPVVTAIPGSVWRSMIARSWHRGCPVGRTRLRLLRINYWGFDGYRYRGEMVLGSPVIFRAAAALREMYDGRYPIRRMYRVDRFGWSRTLHGANDYASMRADNTSGFNCRGVVNNSRVTSPHAGGRAVDLNTWENPYRSKTGLVPDSWWATRSHPRVAWRSASHPVVQIWRSHGFRWTYGNGDSQHVDGRVVAPAGSFIG